MSNFTSTIKETNPYVFQFCSAFFEQKNQSDFVIQIKDSAFLIMSTFPKADPTSNYHMEITATCCEFYFKNNEKGIFVEVLNEFEDFEQYFTSDESNGSTIARLLREKYRETFADQINSGNDLELDEDFNLYFIDNFVNYILNDVYIEE